ncbi:hypothetical protein [Bradyrhizobium sp. 25ACV]
MVVRGMDAPGCIHHTFLDRGKVIGYPETLIGKPDKNGFDAVIDVIHELGLASHGLGFELGNLSAPAAEKFRRRLRGR